MNDVGRTTDGTAQRRPLLRLIVATPPFLVLATSLMLLLVCPFAWDAANPIDSPPWMPPVIALLIAIVGLATGWYMLREVLRRTRQSFEIFPLQLASGTVMFLVAALFELGFSIRVGDSSTYTAAVSDSGEVMTSPGAFFFSGLMATGFLFLLVWGAAWLYRLGVTNHQPNRASTRPPDETDGVGELLREHR